MPFFKLQLRGKLEEGALFREDEEDDCLDVACIHALMTCQH